MSIERREHPRFDVLAQVKVELDNNIHIMEVANLSMSGVYVLTEVPEEYYWIRMGEPLEVDIFPPNNPENIRISGLIARINDSVEPNRRGFAIMFTDVPVETQAELQKFIDSHRVDSKAPQLA